MAPATLGAGRPAYPPLGKRTRRPWRTGTIRVTAWTALAGRRVTRT